MPDKKKTDDLTKKHFLSLDEPRWAVQGFQPLKVHTEFSPGESLEIHNEAMSITLYISLSVTAGWGNSLTEREDSRRMF